MISIGGNLNYDPVVKKYEISAPFVIVGGGIQNLIIYFKNKVWNWRKVLIWFSAATLITTSISVYYFLKARNLKLKENFKWKMSLAEKN